MPREYKSRSSDTYAKRASSNVGDRQGFIQDQFNVWRVKTGDNNIRILPPEPDADHFGMDVHVHYQVGPDKAAVLCPQKHFNKKCPICEARLRAEKAGNEELVKELRPSLRVLIWMIDRAAESDGPVLYPMPRTLDRDICAAARDRQTGEISEVDHPDQGYDLSFLKEGEGRLTKYTGIQLTKKPRPLHRDEDKADSWLDFIEEHPLADTLRWRTYDEIKALYEGVPDDDDEPAPPPRTRRGTTAKPAPVPEEDDDSPPFDPPHSASEDDDDDADDAPPPPKEEKASRPSAASRLRERMAK